MKRANAVLFGPAAVWSVAAGLGLGWTSQDDGAWAPVSSRGEVIGSDGCRQCHEQQHRTWHASFHRTMTQEVQSADAIVLAPFRGETLEVAGFVATFDGETAPHVRVERSSDRHVLLDADVELTVGTHRYQQYVARIDRGGGALERWRLPFAYHPGARRWIHLGGAFLFPDIPDGDADAYMRHFSRWNDNCVFCHNTEPSPGLQRDGTFATAVGELGIGCEACHGPADAHVERQRNPFRRLLSARHDTGDPAITHPGRLQPDRHSEVCGRCHGQRISADVAAVLRSGDGFLPGTALSSVSRPILADARLKSDPPDARPFATRFWPDGTPRLSAYEFQGLLLSPCHDDGKGMACGTCHTMHGETPAMQLRDGARTDAVCVGSCHDPAAYADHGGHGTVSCQGCHMPRVTYGLLQGMASHRITSPDPGAWVGRDDMPDACTQCHVDQSRVWAAASLEILGLEGTVPRDDEVVSTVSRVERDLIGGDPVQRALAAHALARRDAVGEIPRRVRALVDALEDDYPAVRWFAHQGLLALAGDALHPALSRFDFMADPADRVEVVDVLRAQVGASTVAEVPGLLDALVARRDDEAIAIGE